MVRASRRPAPALALMLVMLAPLVAHGEAASQSLGRPNTAAPTGAELERDQPPPTLWDRRAEDATIGGLPREKLGDNQSFLMQLVRTIVALFGVLFLLWAMARVIGPRMGRLMIGRRAQGMQVTDRLNLDGRNSLVRVTVAQGTSYLIACGDHAIKLIDVWPADGTIKADAPPAHSFAQRMGADEVPGE